MKWEIKRCNLADNGSITIGMISREPRRGPRLASGRQCKDSNRERVSIVFNNNNWGIGIKNENTLTKSYVYGKKPLKAYV